MAKQRLSRVVRRANVAYDLESFQSGIPHVPPYVSNGVVGGCFDHFGFQSRPDTGVPEGRTVLGYVDHYYGCAHGLYRQFPLTYIHASFADGTPLNLVDCRSYSQVLDIYDGALTTRYDLYGPTAIRCFASQTVPNLFMMGVERKPSSAGKELVLTFECNTSACQNRDQRWKARPVRVSFDQAEHGMRVTSKTNVSTTEWTVLCRQGTFSVDRTRLVLRLPSGRSAIRIWVKRDGCPDERAARAPADALLKQHTATWRGLWKLSWVDLPEERAQRVWCRTKYYALSHFPSIPVRPLCPTGLAGNIWGYTFPQDVYYVAENLPRLGHLDRAQAAMAFWLDHVRDAEEYCRRLLRVQGVYYPWAVPYGDWKKYEADGVLNADSYELHNPAYVVAMVWHYYLISRDRRFLKRFFPVIEGVFRYYGNIVRKGKAGTYNTYHAKARGQDEASTTQGKLRNLLCAGYSAEYAARAYVYAADVLEKSDAVLLKLADDIVTSGCTRAPLLRKEGFYATYQGDNRPLGSQKHPVQLNPIAFLPMPDMVESDDAILAAWKSRYDLTREARKPLTQGWTLGEFALASARMRAPGEMEKDLHAVQPCRGADPRWVQFYESSFWEGWHLRKAYYFPMMGLYLQAFTDCIVQDWRWYLDLFACLPAGWRQKRFSFAGIRVRGGVEVSGRWNKGRFSVRLKPHGAKQVSVRVALPGVTVAAKNQAQGPARFPGEETVTLEFARSRSVELRSV
jgi:hypothetical protein